MAVGAVQLMGIILSLGLLAAVVLYSGSKVKTAADFTTGGGKAGTWLVVGAIVGSLVGGQATIGTAQLAFTYGLSAWWFTLGSGLGCLVLAIGYAIPLRHSGKVTLLEVIGAEYGARAESFGSILCSVGIFISIISQMLAAMALLTTIFPLSPGLAAAAAVLLMAGYVVFGGAWGVGMAGVMKVVLLYIAMIAGCLLVLGVSGGIDPLIASLRHLLVGTALGSTLGIDGAADFSRQYLGLVARGPFHDIGSGLSLLLGCLATQTYAQAIWSAKSDCAARKGALISACLVPPIGIACILIGLFMRSHFITTAEIALLVQAGQGIPLGLQEIASSAQVFPVFVLTYFPQLLGGVVLGTLLITVVGGGAGLSLGVSTILVNDLLGRRWQCLQQPKLNLQLSRGVLLAILLAAAGVAAGVPGAIINDFGFLSMGLRGAVVFLPLTFALFCPGKFDRRWMTAAILTGPLGVLIGNQLSMPFDSLFLGLGVAGLFCLGGAMCRNRRDSRHPL